MSTKEIIKSALRGIGLGAYMFFEVHKELVNELFELVREDSGRLLEDLRELYKPPYSYCGSDAFSPMDLPGRISKRRIRYISEEFRGANRQNIGEILEGKIAEYERIIGGAIISVSFHDFHGENRDGRGNIKRKNKRANERISDFNIKGDNLGWSASTIKVPVMIEVFRAIDYGKLNLGDKLTVDHKYPLEIADTVTGMDAGAQLTIEDLLNLMIIRSDNEATNMLASLVGLENINQTMQNLGAYRTIISHLLTPEAPRIYTPWNTEGSNITTANDLTRLMTLIYSGYAATTKSCIEMIKILERGVHGPLSGYLPFDAIVGSKMGMITDPNTGDDTHDTGVINLDYALTVMCNRIGYLRIKERKKMLEGGVRIREKNHRKEDDTEEYSTEELRNMYNMWTKLRKEIEKFHRKNRKMPFYFHINAVPEKYSIRPSSATEIIRTISKVVYEIYYNGEVR